MTLIHFKVTARKLKLMRRLFFSICMSVSRLSICSSDLFFFWGGGGDALLAVIPCCSHYMLPAITAVKFHVFLSPFLPLKPCIDLSVNMSRVRAQFICAVCCLSVSAKSDVVMIQQLQPALLARLAPTGSPVK